MHKPNLTMTQQPLWVGAMAAYPFHEVIAKKFTLGDKFDGIYTLYRTFNDMILLPRGACPPPVTVGIDDKRSPGLDISTACSFTPRDSDQDKAVKDMVTLLQAGESFIFEAPTGEGKTTMACATIHAVAKTTLVVVTKTDLLKQWRIEFKKILNLQDNEIGHIQGDIFDVAGKKVVIGMIHSLADYEKYPSWMLSYFGYTIFDECQRLSAPEFSKVASAFSSKLRLGLSARASRADGKDPVFTSNIGPVRVKIAKGKTTFKALVVNTNWRCPRTKLGERIPHGPGKDMHVKLILSKSVTRNKTLVYVTTESYKKGRNIVLFTDFVLHAEVLQSLLYSAGVAIGDVGLYVGENKDKETALRKRIVIATWGMMAESTNEPRLDTCILGMPRADVQQPIGRVLRMLEGKKDIRVIDLVDGDSPLYKGYGFARRAWYRRQGAEVIDVSLGG